jgi:hypothetical protein
LTSTLFWYGVGDSDTGIKNDSRIDYQSNQYVRSLNSSSFLWRAASGTRDGSSTPLNRSNNLSLFDRRQYEDDDDDPKVDDQDHSQTNRTATVTRTRINRIVVLGERHSGTTFVTKYLQDCFVARRFHGSSQDDNDDGGDDDAEKRGGIITVSDRFVNTKHWFQPSPEYVVWTVLNDLHLQAQKLDQQDAAINADHKSSQKAMRGQYTKDLLFSSRKTPLSSDGRNYNDDIDLPWWKEIVFGHEEAGSINAVNSSMTRTNMELHKLFINNTNITSLFNSLLRRTMKFFKSTFVVILVRDPFDW